MTELQKTLFVCIGIMALLLCSFLIAFITSQQKRLKHQKDIQNLRELQQNQLIEAAIRSEEIERHRIAEELHDEVGAILSSSKLHFQGINAASLNKHDNELYNKGKELLNDGIQKVRGISHNLHSSILKEFGLNEAIQHFVNKLTQGRIEAHIALDENYNTQNPENDMSIYRMVQEIVNNLLKHASPGLINITSLYRSNVLTLTIEHNGNGLSQSAFESLRYNKDGLGLKNIQNRIILLQGQIHFVKAENQNTITIQIPVNTAI